MIPNFEILNFSFRNGIFCINLKDCIGNCHSVPFENGYLKNDINNYCFNAMHGFADEYIGHVHVFITNFFGLYHILDNRIIHFTSSNESRNQIVIDISFDSDKPDLIVGQCTDSLYVIIYYPEDKIRSIEGSKEPTDDFYIKYLDSVKLDEIFGNKIINTHQYFNYLADQGYEITEENYDFRTNEERVYDSIDDEDAKRDGFPDLWLDEQLSRADRNEYLQEKYEEMDSIEKNYDELINKFKEIKFLDFVKPTKPDYRPIITFLIPSVLSDKKRSQIVNIKLNQEYYHDIEYYTATEGNIIVNVISKYPLIFDDPNSIINLENFRKEMGIELKFAFDNDHEMIYVDVKEIVEPNEEYPDESSDDYGPPL